MDNNQGVGFSFHRSTSLPPIVASVPLGGITSGNHTYTTLSPRVDNQKQSASISHANNSLSSFAWRVVGSGRHTFRIKKRLLGLLRFHAMLGNVLDVCLISLEHARALYVLKYIR
jgi:hypothetical protein